ncbi:MAG: hypothetical protein ACFFD2_00325 [Promethearchaeota archaeon]
MIRTIITNPEAETNMNNLKTIIIEDTMCYLNDIKVPIEVIR